MKRDRGKFLREVSPRMTPFESRTSDFRFEVVKMIILRQVRSDIFVNGLSHLRDNAKKRDRV